MKEQAYRFRFSSHMRGEVQSFDMKCTIPDLAYEGYINNYRFRAHRSLIPACGFKVDIIGEGWLDPEDPAYEFINNAIRLCE